MSEWVFNDGEEDKVSFWRLQWGDDDDECILAIWPIITETGSLTFSYGYAFNDWAYYEFNEVGFGFKNLQMAKETCEKWGAIHKPEDV